MVAYIGRLGGLPLLFKFGSGDGMPYDRGNRAGRDYVMGEYGIWNMLLAESRIWWYLSEGL